jgi:hypothetical protein
MAHEPRNPFQRIQGTENANATPTPHECCPSKNNDVGAARYTEISKHVEAGECNEWV